MKTIDTEFRLEAPASQLELPAPKVQLALEEWKNTVSELLDLTEAEQNRLSLARMFWVPDEKTLKLIKQDRLDEKRISVFDRVKAKNDDKYVKAA